jgi:hypothetical protein
MLTGNRFSAFYSINRKFADIFDRKRKGALTMLTMDDVETLEQRMMSMADSIKVPPAKPFNVTHPRTHGKLVGLNHEDAVELRELAAALVRILEPSGN